MTDEQSKDRRQLGIVGRISIATLLVVAVHCFGVIWWASNLTHRVEQLEITMERQGFLSERLAIIETNVSWIRGALEKAHPAPAGKF